MAKKKTKIEDLNAFKSEMLLQIMTEACNKANLPGSEIMCVLLACMTEVTFSTMIVERTDENFEEIAALVKKKIFEGLIFYREKEENNLNQKEN